METIIEVHNLEKQYPKIKAVDGLSFSVKKGTCFSLLGPNGAGKSTTLEMMEGINEPSAGEILYKGHSLDSDFRKEAGIQFQSTALQDFMTVLEALQMFSNFYDHTLPLEELIKVCSLGNYLDQDPNRLSGGQRQRVLLAIALVNDPEIVFLDEPTTGLDPQARQNFWALINSIKDKGKTIILTTHYMDEAALLSDEIIVVDHGKIIAAGSPDSLLKQHFDDVIIELPKDDFSKATETVPGKIYRSKDSIEIHTTEVENTLRQLCRQEVPMKHLQVRARTLEDLFIELTGQDLRA